MSTFPAQVKKRKQRKYEEAWLRLKNRDTVKLRVTPLMFARVKKAIIKEKDQDLSFKVLNEIEQFRLHFEYDKQTYELAVQLKAKFGIEEKKI